MTPNPKETPRLDVPYRSGDRCQGCGRSHWLVGRISAECGFCGWVTVLERAA